MDLPPQLPADVIGCIAAASAHYDVDPQSVIDRILARKGASGESRSTAAGAELGVYGVPATSLKNLGPGISVESVRDDDCLNVSVGVFLERMRATPPAAKAPQIASATFSAGAGPKLPRLDAKSEQCVDAAAAAYQLPQPVFRAVLRTEGGWQGLKKRNTNGTYDLGPGQINTIHLPDLAKLGVTEQMLVSDACINIHVAAYRLRVEIERVQDFWRGVGNYHSRTPHLHQAYLKRVLSNLRSP